MKSFLSSFSPHISTSQFQTIKEKQSSNGVTITLENAYASTDRTIIAFTLQISPDLSDDAGGFALPDFYTFVVNGQKETLTTKDVSECHDHPGKRHTCLKVCRSQAIYDAIYNTMKDYADEAQQIHTLIQQYKHSSGTSLLDIAS